MSCECVNEVKDELALGAAAGVAGDISGSCSVASVSTLEGKCNVRIE